jgi:hypothetical protein
MLKKPCETGTNYSHFLRLPLAALRRPVVIEQNNPAVD